MFDFIKKFTVAQNVIIYIRFKKEKVFFTYAPSGIHFDDFPILALTKKKAKVKIHAVGKAVLELPEENKAVVYTPFEPFDVAPDNFRLAEKVIQHLLKKGMPKSALLAPRIIMHPDKTYVAEQEEQAYWELALSAGGREAAVYIGRELQVEDFERILSEYQPKH